MLIIKALKNHVRVNLSNKTVEVYDDYGVKMRLQNLDEETFKAFKDEFQNF